MRDYTTGDPGDQVALLSPSCQGRLENESFAGWKGSSACKDPFRWGALVTGKLADIIAADLDVV